MRGKRAENKQLEGNIILFDYYKSNNDSPFFASSLGNCSYCYYDLWVTKLFIQNKVYASIHCIYPEKYLSHVLIVPVIDYVLICDWYMRSHTRQRESIF